MELKEAKKRDSTKRAFWKETKVRALDLCKNCNASCYIFLMNGVDTTNGTSK